jgi:hypothetical protein
MRNNSQHGGNPVSLRDLDLLVNESPVFSLLRQLYTSVLGHELAVLFGEHYRAVIERGSLPPELEARILCATALAYVHRDLQKGIEFAQRGLKLALRVWGNAYAIDETGLDIVNGGDRDLVKYLDRWAKCRDENWALPDSLSLHMNVRTPYYMTPHDSYEIDASFFRSHQYFANLAEAKEYVIEVNTAVDYILHHEVGDANPWYLGSWELAARENQAAIVGAIATVSEPTAQAFRHAVWHTKGVFWNFWRQGLEIGLGSSWNPCDPLPAFIEGEPDPEPEPELPLPDGLRIEAVRWALRQFIPDLTDTYPVSVFVVKEFYDQPFDGEDTAEQRLGN